MLRWYVLGLAGQVAGIGKDALYKTLWDYHANQQVQLPSSWQLYSCITEGPRDQVDQASRWRTKTYLLETDLFYSSEANLPLSTTLTNDATAKIQLLSG